MKTSLIICTYMRSGVITTLLDSVEKQTVYPDEILIIDGSIDNSTKNLLLEERYKKLKYYLVDKENRGLTKQRNFGISKVSNNIEIVAFLDDDTVLSSNYFDVLSSTFKSDKSVSGVGGLAINENKWKPIDSSNKYNKYKYYKFEDYVIKESSRNVFRKKLGLISPYYYGVMPTFSNGRTTGFPFNGKTYEVDLLIGMSFSFKKEVTDTIKFSTYFEGYGLYEDADYSIRAQKNGKNVINTNLQLYHYHNPSGRPNKYKYGKMVVRNGWYVWRLKYPKPPLIARFKWNLILMILSVIKLGNVITTKKRKEAFTEFLGRFIGWCSLLINKPKIER